MKINLINEIQLDQEIEVINQVFDVQVQEKNGQTYLIYSNEDSEKVILKVDHEELLMTRFSNPKSVMRFVKNKEAIVYLPTPMGIQHFITDTRTYQFEKGSQQLKLSYSLKPLGSEQIFASYQMMISWG